MFIRLCISFNYSSSNLTEVDNSDTDSHSSDDNDSKSDGSSHTDATPGGRSERFASSVVIEVDNKGRLMSITDTELLPSPVAISTGIQLLTNNIRITVLIKTHCHTL